MEQHVGLVILEHLRDQLDIHILDVDFLRTMLSSSSQFLCSWLYTCKFLFIIITASFSFSCSCYQQPWVVQRRVVNQRCL
jgi:hypothetical protein